MWVLLVHSRGKMKLSCYPVKWYLFVVFDFHCFMTVMNGFVHIAFMYRQVRLVYYLLTVVSPTNRRMIWEASFMVWEFGICPAYITKVFYLCVCTPICHFMEDPVTYENIWLMVLDTQRIVPGSSHIVKMAWQWRCNWCMFDIRVHNDP